MSLIQEALKRQQEESAGGASAAGAPPATPAPLRRPRVKPPGAPAPDAVEAESKPGASPPPPPVPVAPSPPSPADAPSPPAAPPPKRRGGIPGVLVGVAALVLVLLALAVWMAREALSRWPRKHLAGLGARPASNLVTAVAQITASDGTQAVAVVKATQSGTSTSAVSSAIAAVVVAPPDEVPSTEVAPQQVRPVTPWPKLTLTAVAGRGQTGSAVINGKPLRVGDTIENVKFVGIGNAGVELEYRGERQTLGVGSSLP